MANKPFSEIVNGLRNCKNVHDLNDWRGFKDCKDYKASRDRDDVWRLWRKAWETDKEGVKAYWDAVRATPEYKAYTETDKVAMEAWEAVEATPEYKDYKEVSKARNKAEKAYLEACKKINESW